MLTAERRANVTSFSERLGAVPDSGGKSSEYELAEQDAERDGKGVRDAGDRPDQRPPRGNPPVEEVDLQRGREQLERVITK
jgi:hypothetical protein